MRIQSRPIIAGTLALFGIFVVGPASAGLHVCKMPDGSTRFSDAACPVNPASHQDPTPARESKPETQNPPATPSAATAQPAPPSPQASGSAAQPAAAPAPTPAPAQTPPAAPSPEATTPGTNAQSQPVAASSTVAEEEQPPREQLRSEPKSKRSLDWLFWIAGIGSTLSWCWLVTHAWREGSKGWSFAMFFFYPITLVYPLVKRSRQTLIALALWIVTGVVSLVTFTEGVDLMWVDKGALARGDEGWPDRSRFRFGPNDQITVLTSVQWKERFWDTRHSIEWVCLKGDSEVATFDNVLRFKGNPYVFHGTIPANQLEPGTYSVEVYIDGEPFQQEAFEVRG